MRERVAKLADITGNVSDHNRHSQRETTNLCERFGRINCILVFQGETRIRTGWEYQEGRGNGGGVTPGDEKKTQRGVFDL